MLFGAIRALIIGDFVFIEHVVVVIVGIWIGGVYGIRGILNSISVIGRIAVILFLARWREQL